MIYKIGGKVLRKSKLVKKICVCSSGILWHEMYNFSYGIILQNILPARIIKKSLEV